MKSALTAINQWADDRIWKGELGKWNAEVGKIRAYGKVQRFYPSKFWFYSSLFNPGPAIEAADLIEMEIST